MTPALPPPLPAAPRATPRAHRATADGVPDLRGVRTVVVGLGRSGVAAATFLAHRGARVIGNDRRSQDDLPTEARATLDDHGVPLRLGGHGDDVFADAELVVVSPGVPPLPAVARVVERGVPVWSELELASRFVSAPVVAITGTNGKSTVTSLVGEAAQAAGRTTFVGGNLGTPLVEAVDHAANGARDGLVVVEASSFQLERVDGFRPRVAALLNLGEDHLDRYPSLAAYAAAKGRIFHAQGPDDVAVVPDDDALCGAIARAGRGRVVAFGGRTGSVRIVECDGGPPLLASADAAFSFPVDELRIAGRHNLDNACAAAVIGLSAELPPDALAQAMERFPGLPHRMALVGEVDGVAFYDDSKATNVAAALAALDGLERDPRHRGRVVLMLGGVDKGGSYAALRARVESGGHRVVHYGAASPRIAEAFGDSHADVRAAGSFEEAFRRAAERARPGDAVLLAPACASFDAFRSYAERGDAFARLVAARGGPGATGGSPPSGEAEASS